MDNVDPVKDIKYVCCKWTGDCMIIEDNSGIKIEKEYSEEVVIDYLMNRIKSSRFKYNLERVMELCSHIMTPELELFLKLTIPEINKGYLGR